MSRLTFPLAFVALSLLAGCGGATGDEGGSGDVPRVVSGLYEGPAADRRSQLCLIARDGPADRFGFIVWGRGDANCSGSGVVRRDRDRIQLLLDGDESCVVDARLDGANVRIAGPLTGECARYYCAGGATLEGTTFRRSEEGVEAAARARDLVGAPLCPSDGGN